MTKSVHRMHWSFFAGKLMPWIVAACFLTGIIVWSGMVPAHITLPQDLISMLRNGLIAIIAAGAVISIVFAVVQWLSTTLTLEEGCVVYAKGILNRNVAKVPVQEIASIDLHQTLFQRILNTGDLVIDMRGMSLGRMGLLNNPNGIQDAVLGMRTIDK